MHPKLLSIWTLVAIGLVEPASAALAFECKGTESVSTCFERGTNKEDMVGEEAKEESAQEKQALRLLPTGVDTGGTALASNTKNFLPLIAMSGLLGEPEKDDAKGTYTFDLNFLIPGLAKDKNAQLQAVANSQPEVSKALAGKLPAESRDATVEKLKSGLSDLDDYLLTFTYSPMGRRIGRGFEQYRNRFEALVWGARDGFLQIPASQDAVRRLGDEVARIEEPLQKSGKITPSDQLFLMSFEDIEKKTDSTVAVNLKRLAEAAVDQEAHRLGFDRKVVADAGLELFGSLIDNQPQLNVSVQQRVRDPIVGGDETMLKVTYAWALADFNHAMDKDCHTALDKPDPEEVDAGKRRSCIDQYTKFVTANQKNIEDGTKFSFSGEYVDIGEEHINRPDVGVTGIMLEGATMVILSAGYTRFFPALGSDAQPLRLDLVASYEDVSDDPARQDRGTATLTVSRKVGNLSVPFGIVYANHGEFLGDVDQKLSAHVGLKFDLFGSKAK